MRKVEIQPHNHAGFLLRNTFFSGVTTLNDGRIDTGSLIRLPSVSIYLIDRLFVSRDEINEALRKHPFEVGMFGPGPAKPYEELVPLFPTGGYNRVPLTDENVLARADIAVAELTKSLASGDLKLIKIKTAETQNFYGSLSKLGLEVETAKKELLDCQVVLFQRWWIMETKLNSFDCKPNKNAK